MNGICKLFGHHWFDTSSRQTVREGFVYTEVWETSRLCTRCGTVEVQKREPLVEGVTKRQTGAEFIAKVSVDELREGEKFQAKMENCKLARMIRDSSNPKAKPTTPEEWDRALDEYISEANSDGVTKR